MTGFQAKTTLTREFSEEEIKDLLGCALEGGSNYWYFIKEFRYPEGKTRDDFEYPHLDLPFNGGSLLITDGLSGESEVTGDDPMPAAVLDYKSMQTGLQIMAEKYPHHIKDIVDENADADTGDAFLQCCLYGEIVFG